MAKTKGPLLSMEAHGSLMKTLNFSQRKSGSQCRKYNKPLVTATPAQRGQRRLTEFLVAQWQNMSDADKAAWATNAAASGLSLPGYHYFLREAQRDLYTHHGLCGYWSFNEIVNNQVLDISGNSLHGTLKPTPPGDAPTLATGKSTRFSNCLLFDGTNDYVSMGTSDKLKTATGSWLFWVKRLRAGHYESYILIGGAGYNNHVEIGIRATGQLGIILRVGTEGYPYHWYRHLTVDETNLYVPIGTWAHLAVVQDGTAAKLYVNGTYATIASTGNDLTAWSNEFLGLTTYIGAQSGDATAKAEIDEVCIYNRVLSADEIYSRYKFAVAKV